MNFISCPFQGDICNTTRVHGEGEHGRERFILDSSRCKKPGILRRGMRENLQEIWTWKGMSNSCKLHSRKQRENKWAREIIWNGHWVQLDGGRQEDGLEWNPVWIEEIFKFYLRLSSFPYCWNAEGRCTARYYEVLLGPGRISTYDGQFQWPFVGTDLIWEGDYQRKDTCWAGKGSGRGRKYLFVFCCLETWHVGVCFSTQICWGLFNADIIRKYICIFIYYLFIIMRIFSHSYGYSLIWKVYLELVFKFARRTGKEGGIRRSTHACRWSRCFERTPMLVLCQAPPSLPRVNLNAQNN